MNGRSRDIMVLALGLWLAGFAAAVWPSPYEPLEEMASPLEARLFDDGADGQWRKHDLLTAALIASGEDRADRLQRYRAKVAALARELEGSGAAAGAVELKAQRIHEFLHQRLFRHYRLEATDLRAALDDSEFNCVSASVLFVCVARHLGLPACATEMPGHAMGRVLLSRGALDVEATCPEWFRLAGDSRRRAEIFWRAIGGHADAAPEPRQVSDVELVALVYYNRAATLLDEQRFAEAVSANAKALHLHPRDAAARDNLLATINNWAIRLAAEGEYERAAERLRLGLSLDPAYPPYRPNYLRLHRQWLGRLLSAGERDRADALRAAAIADPYLADHAAELVATD